MKKLIAILLSCSLLCALASCGGNSDTAQTTDTTQTRETTESSTDLTYIVTPPPADETQVARTLTASSTDGIDMEVTVLGYSSETLGESFYAKGNETVTIKVKITNNSGKTIYQNIPYRCHGSSHEHLHELDFIIKDENGNRLSDINQGYSCPCELQTWSLENGESHEYTLTLAAGKVTEDAAEIDIPCTGGALKCGIDLYENYTDGACEYSGSISFGYGYVALSGSTQNPESISVPVTVRFLAY